MSALAKALHSIVVVAVLTAIPSTAAVAATAELLLTDGRTAISAADFKKELLALPAAVRNTVARDKRQLATYATSILRNRRLVEEAKQFAIAESPEVRAETAKAQREAIARIYLESLTAKAESSLPSDSAFITLAKEHYTVNQAAYTRPESVRVAHILFKYDPENDQISEEAVRVKAQRALDALKSGTNFPTLATEQSEDSASAKQGGELPDPVLRGKTVPPFEKAAFSLKAGETSGLVRTRFGYHIIKVLERIPASIRPFDEVRDEIVKNLRDERFNQLHKEALKATMGTTEVVIDDEVLKALRP